MEQKSEDAKVFSWTLWQHRISLQQAKEYANDGNITVKVRAIAKDGTIQMAELKDLYNVRGILNNANHKVTFKLP